MKIKLLELAKLVDGELSNFISNIPIDGISNIDEIENINGNKVICITNQKYIKKLNQVKDIGAIIIPTDNHIERKDVNVIMVANVRLALAKLLNFFYKKKKPLKYTIDETVKLGKAVKLSKNIHISSYVVIGNNVILGEGCIIYPFVYIADNVKIGEKCIIYSFTAIREGTMIGNRVIIHDGVIIGSDGFGYVKTTEQHYKIPQCGNVVIEDEVEIGANTTIDRATLGSTKIGRGTKLDNLVQIAHNVTIGKNCIIAAQVGIAGSVNIGDEVIIGGQVGITDHVNIADGTIIGGKSGVVKDTKRGEKLLGYPARELNLTKRIMFAETQLPDLIKRIKNLDKPV